MNDTELDEILKTWKTPPIPASLREGVRVVVAAKRRRRPLGELFPNWRLSIATMALVAAVVFVLADASAFPERISPPPYTVDSEVIRYPGQIFGGASAGGTNAIERDWIGPFPAKALLTSYNQAGSEVILSWSVPDHPVEGAFWGAKFAVSDAINRLMRRFLLAPDLEAENYAVVYTAVGQGWILGGRAALVNSGCRSSGRQAEIVGQDVILNYPNIASRYYFSDRTRMTLWLAPELSCFALRATVETQQPDGNWTLVKEKKAVKVTVQREIRGQ